MCDRHDRRRDDDNGQNVAETRAPSSIVFTRVVEDPTKLSDGSGGKGRSDVPVERAPMGGEAAKRTANALAAHRAISSPGFSLHSL